MRRENMMHLITFSPNVIASKKLFHYSYYEARQIAISIAFSKKE